MIISVKALLKRILPGFMISWYHFCLALAGAAVYGFPSRKLKVIGVTGTNGKSTVVEFTTRIFEEAKIPVASQSSIRFKIKDKERPNNYKMTMPGRFFVQRFLKEAADAGCKYAILEVTSEGIKQHRHRFINFDTAVFTNLSPEHIEAHGSFENYKKAKGKLFAATKNFHIINIDDENADFFMQFAAKKKITYGLDKGYINKKCTMLNLKLPGEFNVYNALAAISVGWVYEINLHTCKRAAESVEKIPGRMEEVVSEPFKVFVDYAFTPNALEKVYQTLTADKPKDNKLICLLGSCGGGRDKWKRPVLGQIAAKYCQEIIVTNEDPYDEDPNRILADVKSGISKFNPPAGRPRPNLYEILDRREAVRKALSLAKAGDKVVLTGKGSEPCIVEAHGKKVPWNEKEAVLEEMKALEGN